MCTLRRSKSSQIVNTMQLVRLLTNFQLQSVLPPCTLTGISEIRIPVAHIRDRPSVPGMTSERQLSRYSSESHFALSVYTITILLIPPKTLQRRLSL